jgi:hypothetical protein
LSAPQLKPIEKLKMKLTTKSHIEFGQARYLLIVVQQPIVIPSASFAANLLLFAANFVALF